MFSRDECFIREAGLNYVNIRFKTWSPTDEQVVQFLKIAADPDCQPICVYCNRGAERTGMMSAMYRMVVCGWSREAALQEMTQGPFDYHPIWKQVRIYVENVDVESIRRQIGLAN
jgi:tyrosine-protein phosphatase SIW14